MCLIKIEKKIFNQSFRLDAYFILKTLTKALSKQGKLSQAKKIVAKLAYLIKSNHSSSIFIFLYQAISYIRPLIGFGLKTQATLKHNQKPQICPLSTFSSYQLAIRWLLQGARQRSECTMALRLFHELNDAFNKKGFVLKKKYEWHSRLLSAQVKFVPVSTSSKKTASTKNVSNLNTLRSKKTVLNKKK